MNIAFCKRQGLSCREIARKVWCSPRTAKKYSEHPELIGKPREPVHRPSKADPFREQIASYLSEDPGYRATAIYDRLKAVGYAGGYGLVKRAVRPLRERERSKAYVRFETEPGAQAQVDFGQFQVGHPDGAKRALDSGAGFIICQGVEAGGHVQSTFQRDALLESVLHVSAGAFVIAAGGLAVGTDIARVLKLGADGAMLGTRFVATRESRAHPEYKRMVTEAESGHTALTICFDAGRRTRRSASCVTARSTGGNRPDVRRPAGGRVKGRPSPARRPVNPSCATKTRRRWPGWTGPSRKCVSTPARASAG